MNLPLEAKDSGNDGLRLNPECVVCVSYIGKEQTPVLVVDKFWQTSELLGDLVAAGMEGSCYDALQKRVSAVFARQLALLLQQHLGVAAVRLVPDELRLAMASDSAGEQLPLAQSGVGGRYQLISFMSRNQRDGVGFYRHRSTGFETIGQPQQARYSQALRVPRIARRHSSAGVDQGSNELFESTHYIPAWDNRAVIFPANVLHSTASSNQRQPATATDDFTLMATLEVAVRPEFGDAE